MNLRTRCPSCGATYRLQEPFPPEGKKYRCTCGTVITVSYPDEVVEHLRNKGVAVAAAHAAPTTDGLPGARTTGNLGPSTAPPTPDASADEDLVATEHGEAPAPLLGERRVRSPARRPPPMGPPSYAASSPRAGAGGLQGQVPLSQPPRFPPMAARRPASGGFADPTSSAPPPLEASTRSAPEFTPMQAPPPIAARGAAGPGLTPTDSLRLPPSLESMDRRPVPEPEAAEQTDPVLEESFEPPKAQPSPAEEAAAQAEPPPRRPAKRKARRAAAPRTHKGFFSRWWVRYPLLALVLGMVGGVVAFFAIVQHYSRDLPSVRALEIYEPNTVSVLTDRDGRFVGEFYEEQRYVVPLSDIPKAVQNAFVAAEDASFWEHSGLDYMGIVRAGIANVKQGRMAQGASTITQQVARSFLLTNEKRLSRKIKEAILSRRIEQHFDKEHILFLYLNQIYLGHGAHGVQAAARLYFDKDVKDLGLAEAAILAGLPQAPHTYSPNRNFGKAKARQKYVLGQMVDKGFVSQADADAAHSEELVFVKKRDRNLDHAPYYVEHVRRYLVDKYGHDAVYKDGLQVKLAVDLHLQRAAREAIAAGVRTADKRMGWRGPAAKHEGPAIKGVLRAIDRERTLALRPYHPGFELPEGEPVPAGVLPALTEGELTRGVVRHVSKRFAIVDVGSHVGLLPVQEWSWCHGQDPEKNWRYFQCSNFCTDRQCSEMMINPGDEIPVRVVNEEEEWNQALPSDWTGSRTFPRLAMEQEPQPEAAILSMRVQDGAVLAMVGGSSFEKSEFNRAVQAKRQVGSTFKPLVYASALDHPKLAFTPSSILMDSPIVKNMSGKEGELWKPGNANNEYLGETTFRRGLILSRNIVTLRILEQLGIEYTREYMDRFGFETPLDENLAMGLGSSALTMLEMVRAYSVFPTLGDRQEPYFVVEVKDRHGNVLESRESGERTEDVVDEVTAYQMVNLMHDVVRAGTARDALNLKVPVAGKTGTTNSYRDAWFIGYTPEILTASWVGLDDFKTMGSGMFGGEIALPLWMDFMEDALPKYPAEDYEKPQRVEWVRIDSQTGKLARENQAKAVKVAFRKGTEPQQVAPAAGAVDAADFLSGGF